MCRAAAKWTFLHLLKLYSLLMEDRLEQSYIWVDWSSAQKLFLDCPPMAISVPNGYPVENLLWHLKNLGAAGKPKVISDLETFPNEQWTQNLKWSNTSLEKHFNCYWRSFYSEVINVRHWCWGWNKFVYGNLRKRQIIHLVSSILCTMINCTQIYIIKLPSSVLNNCNYSCVHMAPLSVWKVYSLLFSISSLFQNY